MDEEELEVIKKKERIFDFFWSREEQQTILGLLKGRKMKKELKEHLKNMEMNIIEPIIHPIFVTPVMKFNMNREFTKDELQLLLSDIPTWKDDKIGMVNHRSNDLYLFDNFAEKLKDIKSFCALQLKIYLEEIEGIDTDTTNLRITQSWINKSKPQEYHHAHTHPNSYLSGILYISCLPNDHINLFQWNHYEAIKFPIKNKTPYNLTEVQVNVTEGDLILFPSWLGHATDLNETENKERISFSFNTFPIGELGEYVQINQLKL